MMRSKTRDKMAETLIKIQYLVIIYVLNEGDLQACYRRAGPM